jgi:class 3 adenylate cyclase
MPRNNSSNKKSPTPPGEIECAVLFVDIRGSTRAIIAEAADRTLATRRITAMFAYFFEVTSALDCPPDFFKSTGDGLMSVWHLEPARAAVQPHNILTLALRLCEQLPERMTDPWGKQRPSIGIGLSRGQLTYFEDGKIRDYFGEAANVAAKCQDSARPEGLIVTERFLELLSSDQHRAFFSGTKPQLFEKPVPRRCELYDFKVRKCGQTEPVRFPVEWTCLAWPGFSITGAENRGDADRPAPIGLNRVGITVVTHEGLKGNIGTLAIWPRYTPVTAGDRFEIIIDDVDTLAMLHRQNAIEFYKDRGESIRNRLRQLIVDRTIDELEHALGFAFIPIRCGVNALCANTAQPSWRSQSVNSIRAYRDVRVLLENNTLKANRVGLYDNLGASMPILLMMMSDDPISKDEVFDLPIDGLVDKLKSLLARTKTDKRSPHFLWYATRDTLALDIQAGNIDLVLGGGAWLGSPVKGSDPNPPLACHIPEDDGGFLWMEGAALSRAAGDEQASELLEFLTQTVLTPDYQMGLANGSPYGSSPVIGETIRRILASIPEERPGSGFIDAETSQIYRPDFIDAETKQIYSANGRLDRGRLTIRKCPERYPEWLDAWEEVKQTCCVARL